MLREIDLLAFVVRKNQILQFLMRDCSIADPCVCSISDSRRDSKDEQYQEKFDWRSSRARTHHCQPPIEDNRSREVKRWKNDPVVDLDSNLVVFE